MDFLVLVELVMGGSDYITTQKAMDTWLYAAYHLLQEPE